MHQSSNSHRASWKSRLAGGGGRSPHRALDGLGGSQLPLVSGWPDEAAGPAASFFFSVMSLPAEARSPDRAAVPVRRAARNGTDAARKRRGPRRTAAAASSSSRPAVRDLMRMSLIPLKVAGDSDRSQ